MTKVPKWMKLFSVVLLSALAGVGIFVCLSFRYMWHPVPLHLAFDDYTGVTMRAAVYGKNPTVPWWENGDGILIEIRDWKNDGRTFRTVLYDGVEDKFAPYGDIAFLKGGSGEKFAVVNYFNYFYILHRTPVALGKENLEQWFLPGRGLAVAPDESGLFIYNDQQQKITLTKYDWNKKVVASTIVPHTTGVIQQPTFFAKGKKLAFKQSPDTSAGLSSRLYIWDLEKNIVTQFSGKEKTDVGRNIEGDLIVENDLLYIDGAQYGGKKVLVQ